MISEEGIEQLIQPLLARQQNINTYVLEIIAERVEEIGKLLPSDLYKLQSLYRSGADVQKINKEIARITGLQVADIKRIIREIALDAYIDTKVYYDYRQRPFIPFAENIELRRMVEAVANQTANTFVNISKAQAFMIRDLANPKVLKPTSLSNTYQSVIDEAIQASQQGTTDYNTAMRRTMRQLADSGIRRVEYSPESGRRYTQRLDTALRRNLLDGIRAVNQGVQDITGQQFGADGKEMSVHMNPALDHEHVQGHQFYNEEFEKMQRGESCKDVQGRTYKGFDRAIGTLNCRHFMWSIIVGVAIQNFSDKQLQDIITKNHKGYTLQNGKHLTMYECTQHQRQLETKIRYAKDGQIMARACGDIELAKAYQRKINKYTQDYKTFSNACGLQQKSKKLSVSNYRKISV